MVGSSGELGPQTGEPGTAPGRWASPVTENGKESMEITIKKHRDVDSGEIISSGYGHGHGMIYIYIHTYVYIYKYVYVSIYIYIHSECKYACFISQIKLGRSQSFDFPDEES